MSSLWLALALFFPRTVLFFSWLTDNIPVNDTPFALDVVATLLAPRILIAYWGYDYGIHIAWVALFVLIGLAEKFGASSRASSSRTSSSSSDDE
jgi:hypothetical protein